MRNGRKSGGSSGNPRGSNSGSNDGSQGGSKSGSQSGSQSGSKSRSNRGNSGGGDNRTSGRRDGQSGQGGQGQSGQGQPQNRQQPNSSGRSSGRSSGSSSGSSARGQKSGHADNAPARSSLIEIPIRTVPGKGNVPVQESKKLPPRRYGIIFFETLAAAKNDVARLQDVARGYDQLNIVIRSESPMDDVELSSIGKLFAGAAWALIHDRRVAEGWYNEAH